MLNLKHFYGSLPLVAATLSKKFGVSVRFEGDEATVAFRSRVITLPADTLCEGNDSDRSSKIKLTLGYLAHETAHLCFSSDLDEHAVARKDLTPQEQFFWGALIDGKDERLLIDKFPGVKGYLIYLAVEKIQRFLEGSSDAMDALSHFFLFYVRNIGHRELHVSEVEKARLTLLKFLPESLIQQVEVIAKKGVFASNLFELRDAAKELAKLFQDESGSSDNSDQSGDSGDGDSSNDKQSSQHGDSGSSDEEDGDSGNDDSTSATGSDSTDDSDDSSSGHGEQSKGKEGDESTSDQKRGTSKGQSDSDGAFQNITDEQKNAIRQILDDMENMPQEDINSFLNTNKDENGEENNSDVCNDGEKLPSFNSFDGMPSVVNPDYRFKAIDTTKVRQKSVVLRTRIANYLQTQKMEKSMTARRGRLATNKLYRLAVDDCRVFNKKQPVKSNNVAIHLLLDGSGSMNGVRAEIAYPAAQAFAEAVSNYPDINVAASVFCSGGVAGKSGNIVYPVLKHKQKISVNTKWGFLPRGNTPLAEGIYYAWSELMVQPEERKILILLTDGQPNDKDSTKTMVSLCKKSGMEVIGLSIDGDYLKSYLDKGSYYLVYNDDQVVTAYFSILQNLLKARR